MLVMAVFYYIVGLKNDLCFAGGLIKVHTQDKCNDRYLYFQHLLNIGKWGEF